MAEVRQLPDRIIAAQKGGIVAKWTRLQIEHTP
jgi:hypothetical protein